MQIWYHGTKDEAVAEKIAREGFAPESYFAAHLEDALEFGGPHIFQVRLSHIPIIPENWQMRISEAIPATEIVRRSHFNIAVLEDYPDRRKAVFEANRN